MDRTYVSIDLKSFYASVECVDLMLDPLTTNLVVADASRTDKTICLAVSPGLKKYGIPGRPRLFEVVQKVAEINRERLRRAPGHRFTGKSSNTLELDSNPSLELDYIVAPPRMARYVAVSSEIYGIYMKHVAPEDMHVYSIDEVFMDVTMYLRDGQITPREFTMDIIHEVLKKTGITATAGIGTNLYLCKIAMDIVAKKMPADRDGVRIAELDELSYRKQLWDHRPLTDFWRIGHGTEATLQKNSMFTLGDVARCSLQDEDRLFRLFGVNAELLIDHAWGREPCGIAAIKAFRPESSSLSSGQVLPVPYSHEKSRIVVREMADLMALDLVDKGLLTGRMGLVLNYDAENLKDPTLAENYTGEVTADHYGRLAPKYAHGFVNLKPPSSSTRIIVDAVLSIFDRIADPKLSVRRITVTAEEVIPAVSYAPPACEQLNLFDAPDKADREAAEAEALEREHRRQEAILHLQKRYGKNAVLKGTSLQPGATTIERNTQIGGHKA